MKYDDILQLFLQNYIYISVNMICQQDITTSTEGRANYCYMCISNLSPIYMACVGIVDYSDKGTKSQVKQRFKEWLFLCKS